MEKRVLCLLADGFEEIEFVTPVDLLRRAGVEVVVAGLGGLSSTGRSGIRIEADVTLEDTASQSFDMLLIPGGPAVSAMRADGRPAAIAADFHDAGKPVAAICAAPLILLDAGILTGRRFTAFRSVRNELGAGCEEARVVVDGNLITSRGAGTAQDFALTLVSALAGEEAAATVAADIMA